MVAIQASLQEFKVDESRYYLEAQGLDAIAADSTSKGPDSMSPTERLVSRAVTLPVIWPEDIARRKYGE